MLDRDDLLYVIRGSLRLELEGREPVVLEETGAFSVIPAGTPFAATAGPAHDSAPCLFLAITPVSATFTRLAGPTEA